MLLGLFLLLLPVLLFINFSVDIELIASGLDVRPAVRFGIGGLLFPMPTRLVTKLVQMFRNQDISTLENFVTSSRLSLRILNNLFQKIKLLHLEILLSLGSPFLTSVSVGGLWTILGPLLTEMSASNRIDTTPKILIEPDYGIPKFQLHLHCIFQFRLGQIIINELSR